MIFSRNKTCEQCGHVFSKNTGTSYLKEDYYRLKYNRQWRCQEHRKVGKFNWRNHEEKTFEIDPDTGAPFGYVHQHELRGANGKISLLIREIDNLKAELAKKTKKTKKAKKHA